MICGPKLLFTARDNGLEMDLAEAPTGPIEPTLGEGALLGGRFRLIRVIGSSERGSVYLARDERHRTDAAVRILPPLLADDPDYISRVRRSVLVGRRVLHPSVCRVVDVEQAGPLAYVSMELVRGERLKDILANRRFTRSQTRRVLLQTCAGVAAVHQEGEAHGDLRSSNVMVSGGRAKVMDFGLSCVVADPDPSARCALAPGEEPGRPTPTGDVYAIGVLAYRMLTGRRLARIPDEADPMLDVPASFRDFMRGCLCPDADQRYADAGELVRVLERTRRRVSFTVLERLDARLVGVGATAIGFAIAWALLAPTQAPAPRPGPAMEAAIALEPVPARAPAQVDAPAEPRVKRAPPRPRKAHLRLAKSDIPVFE
jgi:hypothetical protein